MVWKQEEIKTYSVDLPEKMGVKVKTLSRFVSRGY
jgi:hypothetical protein